MAGNNYFNFKQFKIIQEKSAMKVGTDGILLGAWVNVHNVKSILDIGAGTGLISLMLAQRCEAEIRAIEIDEDAAKEAQLNVRNSQWKNRIEVDYISFQEFVRSVNQKFELIVSNPPFFKDSLKKKNPAQTLARHTDSLSFAELITGASQILINKGRFAVVLPEISKLEFIDLANTSGLKLIRETLVCPKTGASPNRCLLEFSKSKQTRKTDEITIYSKVGTYTSEFKNLTKEFYLGQ